MGVGVEGVCGCARACVCVLVCLGDSFRYDNYICKYMGCNYVYVFLVGGGARARTCVCVLVCLGDSFRYDNYIQRMPLCECVFWVYARARVCVFTSVYLDCFRYGNYIQVMCMCFCRGGCVCARVCVF